MNHQRSPQALAVGGVTGNIFEEIEVNGKKISAKIDTASDFALVLKMKLANAGKCKTCGVFTLISAHTNA